MAKKKAASKNASGSGTAVKGKPSEDKQTWIPGTEPPSIPDIDSAARSAWLFAQPRSPSSPFVRFHEQCHMSTPVTHDLEEYEFENFVVTRSHSETENVNVRTKKAKDD